eukprot:TRINITY_DN55561_c0_g1_i1.p1 TRINITY_DN55561_c0_g1~~TRINITY_DN55561_c0_g1_i1.p1  ORF type:complete len:779 (-),score=212.56 TRINITY_DN55561_c0_g1_i1:44-2380(-)
MAEATSTGACVPPPPPASVEESTSEEISQLTPSEAGHASAMPLATATASAPSIAPQTGEAEVPVLASMTAQIAAPQVEQEVAPSQEVAAAAEQTQTAAPTVAAIAIPEALSVAPAPPTSASTESLPQIASRDLTPREATSVATSEVASTAEPTVPSTPLLLSATGQDETGAVSTQSPSPRAEDAEAPPAAEAARPDPSADDASQREAIAETPSRNPTDTVPTVSTSLPATVVAEGVAAETQVPAANASSETTPLSPTELTGASPAHVPETDSSTRLSKDSASTLPSDASSAALEAKTAELPPTSPSATSTATFLNGHEAAAQEVATTPAQARAEPLASIESSETNALTTMSVEVPRAVVSNAGELHGDPVESSAQPSVPSAPLPAIQGQQDALVSETEVVPSIASAALPPSPAEATAHGAPVAEVVLEAAAEVCSVSASAKPAESSVMVPSGTVAAVAPLPPSLAVSYGSHVPTAASAQVSAPVMSVPATVPSKVPQAAAAVPGQPVTTGTLVGGPDRGGSSASGAWPQAAYSVSSGGGDVGVAGASASGNGGSDWPEATYSVATSTSLGGGSGAGSGAGGCGGSWPEAVSRNPGSSEGGAAGGSPTKGLRGLVSQLNFQLMEEVSRREKEEEELEERTREKKALLEELEQLRRRRANVASSAEAAAEAALEAQKQREELVKSKEDLTAEIARQAEELNRLHLEAEQRSGVGRDWARAGPETDALVETKLQLAEANDRLAQARLQLWLNKEGLKKQLSELQAENAALRGSRGRVSAAA